jgi:hypothetical protein
MRSTYKTRKEPTRGKSSSQPEPKTELPLITLAAMTYIDRFFSPINQS